MKRKGLQEKKQNEAKTKKNNHERMESALNRYKKYKKKRQNQQCSLENKTKISQKEKSIMFTIATGSLSNPKFTT